MKFVVILGLFLVTFSVATHSILCPNDALDADGISRVLAQQWMFLVGSTSLDDFRGQMSSSSTFCNSTKQIVINNKTENIPRLDTTESFAPAILAAELILTNVMMLNVLIAIFNDVHNEIKRDRTKHYRHEFLKLTLEYHYRLILPSPLSIILQVLNIFNQNFRKNPFGVTGKMYIIQLPGVLKLQRKDAIFKFKNLQKEEQKTEVEDQNTERSSSDEEEDSCSDSYDEEDFDERSEFTKEMEKLRNMMEERLSDIQDRLKRIEDPTHGSSTCSNKLK